MRVRMRMRVKVRVDVGVGVGNRHSKVTPLAKFDTYQRIYLLLSLRRYGRASLRAAFATTATTATAALVDTALCTPSILRTATTAIVAATALGLVG